MDSTPNLALPFIMAAQAQKHVTHNEALRALDAVVQLMVLDKDLAIPPGSPTDGARYIVAASPTGAWAGQAGNVAAFQDGAWAFYTPQEGWLAWVADEDKVYAWSGSAWAEIVANPGVGAPLWGINATADTTNRLAVKSPASLFDNVGNGHQQKINKAAAGDTASTLYQTNYSGRAEYGLAGDDDFHVKVSPDGSTWHEALVVDGSTGAARFPNTAYIDLPAASAPATPASGKVRVYAKSDKRFYQKDDTGAEVGLAGGMGVNLLTNPDGRISQRHAGTAATTTDDTYGGPDRWYSLTQTASIEVTRGTAGENGMPFYNRITQTQASAQRMARAQIVENIHCSHLRGQSVVLSGRIRCSASQAVRYAILEWTGTADNVTSDVVNDWTSAGYTAGNFFLGASLTVTAVGAITPAANTWTDLTELVGVCSASLNNLIVMIWTEATAAQNVTLDFRMQLERGSVASPYMPRDQTYELALCQRYYQKSYNTAVVPGTVTTLGQLYRKTESTSLNHFVAQVLLNLYRNTPALVTLYNPNDGNTTNPIRSSGGADHPASVVGAGARGFAVVVNASSIGADEALTTHYVVESEL